MNDLAVSYTHLDVYKRQAYDCMAEGTLRCTIRARTLEEAESLFAEELDRAEEDHPGLQLRLQWVTEDE